jgi:hypothetical protein
MMATTFGITKAAPIPANALAMANKIRLPVQKPLISDQRVHRLHRQAQYSYVHILRRYDRL